MQGKVDKAAEKQAEQEKAALKKAAHDKAKQEKADHKKAKQEKAEEKKEREKAYKWVEHGLKDIEKALYNCDNAQHFHSIVASYGSIDLNRSDIQKYLKTHHRTRSNLIALENNINNLITANRQIYGHKIPEPEVLTSTVDRTIVIETTVNKAESPKSPTDTIPQIPEAIEPATSVITKPSLPVINAEPTPEVMSPSVSVEKASLVIELPTPSVPITIQPQEAVAREVTTPIITKPQEEATTSNEESVQDIAEEEPQQKAAQLRAVRETQLREFNKYLKKLAEKRDQFHKEYPKDPPENPHKIYGAMNLLVSSLEQSAESYKNGSINLEQFKADTTQSIRNKRDGVISEHRGSKEILVNLLLAISTLGVGYLLAALFTGSFTPIKVNTDSVNQLDETKDVVNRLQA